MIRNDDDLRKFLNEETPPTHPSDAMLLDWTNRIRSGERGPEVDGIARHIIMDFRLRQFLGVPQSAIALEWIGEALDAIMEYADPMAALGLQARPKRRPKNPQRGWDVSCWVAVAQKRGYERAVAIVAAAEQFSMDESNVRKLLKNRPESMNPDDDVWDEYFQLRGRPLPLPRTGNK